MKKILLIVNCCLLSIGNVAAQSNDSLFSQSQRDVLVNQLNRVSTTSRLFPLADELMLLNSFAEAATLLSEHDFDITSFNEGVLKAESDICDLMAVNRMNRPEQIDTLTLFLKRPLNRNILQDSLKRASYTYIKTSADQRYDWYKRADNVNLAVYYLYNDIYRSAMLFARPQRTIHIGRE